MDERYLRGKPREAKVQTVRRNRSADDSAIPELLRQRLRHLGESYSIPQRARDAEKRERTVSGNIDNDAEMELVGNPNQNLVSSLTNIFGLFHYI